MGECQALTGPVGGTQRIKNAELRKTVLEPVASPGPA